MAPRDVAMAGAATALGDHYGAVYYDPAGMAEANRVRFHAVWQQSESHLKIDGDAARGVDPSRATSTGLILPLPLTGALANRITVGVLVHSPNDRLIRVYSRPADEPQFVLLQNHAQVLGVYVGGAVRATKSLSLGAGTRLAANVRAQVELQGSNRGVETISNGYLTTTATPIFAARWAPPSGKWAGALVYRHRFRQVFATPAANDLGGLRTPTPGVKTTTLFVPTQVVLGGAWHPGPWTATLDLAYKKWSEMPDPTLVLGRLPDSQAPFPAFHDTVTGRAGVERRVPVGTATLAVRGGYGFEPSPAPAMTDDYNLFDNDRHILALGAGYAIPWREGRIRIDAAMQAHLLAPRSHTKDAADVPAGTELDYETGGHVRVGTVGVAWEY